MTVQPSLSVMTDIRILKVVGRHAIGLQFLGIHVFSFFGSRLVVHSTSQSGVCFGSLMISEYASAMGFWGLLNSLIQKLASLSGLGDFQFVALVMLTLSSGTVRSFHSIWLICCSSSSWSLIHWASSFCLTSCSSMFCQNFFTSPVSGGFSVLMVFFPSSL